MKLATLSDGSRDGLLAVVSRDGTLAHHAAGIAATLQRVLDDWNFVSPQLEDLSAALNGGKARHAFAFDPGRCLAPLPRAFGLALDGTALPSDALRPGAGAAGAPAVVVADVEAGTDADAALDRIRLLLWFDAATGAFAPLAITPDEAGERWQRGRLGQQPGPHFGERIAALAAARHLGAGHVVAAGDGSGDPGGRSLFG